MDSMNKSVYSSGFYIQRGALFTDELQSHFGMELPFGCSDDNIDVFVGPKI